MGKESLETHCWVQGLEGATAEKMGLFSGAGGGRMLLLEWKVLDNE